MWRQGSHSFTLVQKSSGSIPLIINNTMIGLGGLLLVVSHLFAVPVLVLWVGLEKNVIDHTRLRGNIFAGSHIKHHWKCCNSVATGAQYVTPHSKVYCEKVKMCWFSSGNWFFCTKFVELAAAAKGRNTVVHLQKRV